MLGLYCKLHAGSMLSAAEGCRRGAGPVLGGTFQLVPRERGDVRGKSMAIDVQRARRETPGAENVLLFNNAGAALMPQPVLHATIGHLQLEALVGGYEAAAQASEAVERVYDAAAALVGCQRDEIAIVENATRAWDMAF